MVSVMTSRRQSLTATERLEWHAETPTGYRAFSNDPVNCVDVDGYESESVNGLMRNSQGQYVWVVGDGDTMGAISRTLTGRASNYKRMALPESGDYAKLRIGEQIPISGTGIASMLRSGLLPSQTPVSPPPTTMPATTTAAATIAATRPAVTAIPVVAMKRKFTRTETDVLTSLERLADEVNREIIAAGATNPGNKKRMEVVEAITQIRTDLARALQEAETPALLPYPTRIALAALQEYAQQDRTKPNWSEEVTSEGPSGSNVTQKPGLKCNGYVAGLLWSATGQFFQTRTHWGSPMHPFSARDWGTGQVASRHFYGNALLEYKSADPSEGRLGDVVATNMDAAHNHVGIYLGHGLYVSATNAGGNFGGQVKDGVVIRDIESMLKQSIGRKLNITRITRMPGSYPAGGTDAGH